MVEYRELPVLEDVGGVGVDQLYGVGSTRIYLIFGRDGCLIPTEGLSGARVAENLQLLMPYLEQAAAN